MGRRNIVLIIMQLRAAWILASPSANVHDRAATLSHRAKLIMRIPWTSTPAISMGVEMELCGPAANCYSARDSSLSAVSSGAAREPTKPRTGRVYFL